MYLDTDKAKEAIRRNVLILSKAYGSGSDLYCASLIDEVQDKLLDAMTEIMLKSDGVSIESKIFAMDLASCELVLRAPGFHKSNTDGVRAFTEKFIKEYKRRIEMAQKLEKSFQGTSLYEQEGLYEKDTVLVEDKKSSSFKP